MDGKGSCTDGESDRIESSSGDICELSGVLTITGKSDLNRVISVIIVMYTKEQEYIIEREPPERER